MDASDRTRMAIPPWRAGRGIGAVVLALMLCGFPALARAQNPFAPLPSQPAPAPVVTVPPTTSASRGGAGDLSSTEQIALFVAGGLLIAGIAFLIRRDAHTHTPARPAATDRQRATTRPRAKRVEQSRARAKAARAQRKRRR